MEVSLMGIHREGCLTFARIERNTLVLRSAIQSNQSSLYGLQRGSKNVEDQMAKSSA